MVILITGATGFLGSVHVNQMLNSDKFDTNDFRLLVRKSSDYQQFEEKGLELFFGDLSKPETLEGIMKDVTDVYHIAAIVINESVSKEKMFSVNFNGTKTLVDRFLNATASENFIFASSFGVYGFDWPEKPISEDFPLNANNAYQQSKLASENYLWQKQKVNGIKTCAIRNPLILGPYDTVTSLRVCKALLNKKIPIMGNGENTFSMVDARDSSNAMITAANKPKAKGNAYNVKSFDISQKDYFKFYADACGAQEPTRKVPYFLAYFYAWLKELFTPPSKEVLITRTRVKRYGSYRLVNISKIQEQLQWHPQFTNPFESISNSVEWLKDNGYLSIP